MIKSYTPVEIVNFSYSFINSSGQGILATGMGFTLLGWCIMKKGPVYASVFNPLSLALVAVLSSFLLSEKLYLGW